MIGKFFDYFIVIFFLRVPSKGTHLEETLVWGNDDVAGAGEAVIP